MSNQVVTSEQFKWILLEIFLQIFLYIVQLVAGGGMRSKHFGKEYMERHFKDELEREEIPVPGGGVPDCGTGRFSEKLKPADWLDYNTTQFISATAVQSILASTLVTFLLGVYLPKWGVAVGLYFIIWRIVYSIGAKVNPSTLALLEPLSQAVLCFSTGAVAVFAYRTGASA